MRGRSITKRAAAWAAKTHGLEAPLAVDEAQATDPSSARPLYRVTLVDADQANGPAYAVLLDHRGAVLEQRPELEPLFERTVLTVGEIAASGAAPASIVPATNRLTLHPGDRFDETVTVQLPRRTGLAQADVYFLADTTGSMAGVLKAVQAAANRVLAALAGLGADLAFGVGQYKDATARKPDAFRHQLSPTGSTAAATAAIDAWAAGGGRDYPEAQFLALDGLAVPPGGAIGWRPGSRRIIVWFGDAPGHDPICTDPSGTAVAITEASVTAKLVAEGIVVLAVSTADPGLDGDPKAGAKHYRSQCAPPKGRPGQGTRIASATGGAFASGIHAGNIVEAIVARLSGAAAAVRNLRLLPSAAVAPFVAAIDPAAGHGPLPADRDHALRFGVQFTGSAPCRPQAQQVSGTLDAVADGTVVARKSVQITLPACAMRYAVKFVCGTEPLCPCDCAPVGPGRYATEINIHNVSGREVQIRTRVIPLVLAGAPVGREPAAAQPRAEDGIVLPPHTATLDDCCRLTERLFGAPSASALTIGILEITASAEVAVTAVYTASGLDSGRVSIDVQHVPGRAH